MQKLNLNDLAVLSFDPMPAASLDAPFVGYPSEEVCTRGLTNCAECNVTTQ